MFHRTPTQISMEHLHSVLKFVFYFWILMCFNQIVMCRQVYDSVFTHLLCNRLFRGCYDSWWQNSQMMAPVMCLNMLEICQHLMNIFSAC